MDNYNKAKNASVIISETYASKCEKECDAGVLQSDTLTGAENYPWPGGDFKIPRGPF